MRVESVIRFEKEGEEVSFPIERVVYNPRHDQIGTLVPLYARYENTHITNMEGYSCYLSNDVPLAYVVNTHQQGQVVCLVVSAAFVEKKFLDGTIVDLEDQNERSR